MVMNIVISMAMSKLQMSSTSSTGASRKAYTAPLRSGGDGKNDEWLENMEELCQRGNAHAMFTVGQYYERQGNQEKALLYYHKAEAKGDTQARYQLAVAYYDGIGVTADLVQGFQYMLTVAEGGCPQNPSLQTSAQFNVGCAYNQGFGVRQSYSEAVRWWTQAAEVEGCSPGAVQAQNMLGMHYSRVESQNLRKAHHWHCKAAGNGSVDSMAALGQLYWDGLGCKRSEEEGLQWLKRAAARGNTYGTGLLSMCYFRKKLFGKAIEQAKRVCESGSTGVAMQEGGLLEGRGAALAYFVLGRCLHLGTGVPQQLEKAKELYDKAAKCDKDLTHTLHQKATLGQL